MKKIFVRQNGLIRWGWLLSATAAIYSAASGGVHLLYWHGYEAMMAIWGVTNANVHRAPGAVQFLYQWSNVLLQLIQNALLIGGTVLVMRLSGQKNRERIALKALGKGAAAGAVCVAGIWCVLMLLGSVRLGWRITKPVFSINTYALLLTTCAAAVGEGMFFYYGVYGSMKKRLPAWAALCVMMAINIMLALMSSILSPLRIANSMLTALVCALFADRIGIGAAIGFRFAWSFFDQAVFGFAGAEAALYETYPVNLYWLCGGNGGLMNGLLTTIVLLCLSGLLLRGMWKTYLPVRRENRT